PTRTGVFEQRIGLKSGGDGGVEGHCLPAAPSPSCPLLFRPQHHTVPVPSPRSAQVWNPPVTTVTAPVKTAPVLSLTGTGEGLKLSKVPSPRCPESPKPQHRTVPSLRSAHACSAPVTTLAP